MLFLFLCLIVKVQSELETCPCPFDVNGTTVVLKMKFRIYSMKSFDDVGGILIFDAAMVTTMYEPCGWELAVKLFPQRSKIFGDAVTMDVDHFWKPVIWNEGSNVPFLYTADNSALAVNVFKTGWLDMWEIREWSTNCKINLIKFPFDVQRCSYRFHLWEQRSLNYVAEAIVDMTFPTFEGKPKSNTVFDIEMLQPIIRNTTWPCGHVKCKGCYVDFPILLRRKWFPYYFYGIFLPQFLLSILQLSAFLLPFDETDRITFSGTLFLAYAVANTNITSYIQKTSDNVLIVASTNVAMLGSMLATISLGISYAARKMVKKRYLVTVQKVLLAIFTIFYILLYSVTIGIANS